MKNIKENENTYVAKSDDDIIIYYKEYNTLDINDKVPFMINDIKWLLKPNTVIKVITDVYCSFACGCSTINLSNKIHSAILELAKEYEDSIVINVVDSIFKVPITTSLLNYGDLVSINDFINYENKEPLLYIGSEKGKELRDKITLWLSLWNIYNKVDEQVIKSSFNFMNDTLAKQRDRKLLRLEED